MKGYALVSSVASVPLTPILARAHLESLRRCEAMWKDFLINPPADDLAATTNARMWEHLAQVDLVWSPKIGDVSNDPDLSVIHIVADFSAFPDVPANDEAFHIDRLGRPVSYISMLACGEDWVSASTHELHESRIDGPCFGTVLAPDGTHWAREVDDPLQGSEYEEWGCPGIKVSNCAGPRYFGLSDTGPLDICGAVTEAFQQLPGGYHESTGPDGVTTNVYGDKVTARKREYVDRRGVRHGLRRQRMITRPT